jgi:hypothetical protein
MPPDKPNERVGAVDRAFIVELIRRLSPLIEGSEMASPAKRLKVRGNRYRDEVTRVLAQIARLPVLGSAP